MSSTALQVEERYGLAIGGAAEPPRSGEYARVVNPATEEGIAEVAVAGAEDVDAAVDSAAAAAAEWRERTWT